MKKFYVFLWSVLMGILLPTALHAETVNFIIDDPERVNIEVNYSVVEGLVAGSNTIEIQQYVSVYVRSTDGNFITSVVRESTGNNEYISSYTSCYLNISGPDTFTITSASADEIRNASCTITVDHASDVSVQRYGTYTKVPLNDGENTVKFIDGVENTFYICPAVYGNSIYRVTLNGETQTGQYSQFYLTMKDGDKVEITSEFPDITCPIKFSYATEEAKGYVTSVTLDNENVENFNDGFDAKAGQTLTIFTNGNDYQLNEFTVNGVSQYVYSQYSFTVTEATEIYVNATKYGTFNAYVTVDNPDAITLFKGYTYNNVTMPLVEGENVVELNSNSNVMQIAENSGYYITSILADGAVPDKDYSGAYTIYATKGMKVSVETAPIVKDQKAMIYVDDITLPYYFSLYPARGESLTLESGYNELIFSEAQNPFRTSSYGAPVSEVYVNGEMAPLEYEYSSNYIFSLKNNDVVRIYFASTPETYNVTFDADEDIEGEFAVTTDYIHPETAWNEGLKVLSGTRLAVVPGNETSIKVFVNDTEVAVEEGEYAVEINADTNVRIEKDVPDGISSIAAGQQNTIYSLDGRRMNGKSLQNGVYVKNGKKVIVKDGK